MFYEDYFDEDAAENAEVVAEITNIAKGLVSQDIKTKIENLEKRNAELVEELAKYRDFAQTKSDLESKIRSLEWESKAEYQRGYDECRRKKLQNLLDLEYGYAITYDEDWAVPKCDKCDRERYIHFKSPSGKDYKEQCSCGKRKRVYSVAKTQIESVIFNYNDNDERPSRYYRRMYGETEIGYEYDSNKIWIYDKFSDINEIMNDPKPSEYYNYVFESEESCQKYVDWLNEKEKAKYEE